MEFWMFELFLSLDSPCDGSTIKKNFKRIHLYSIQKLFYTLVNLLESLKS